MRFAIMFVCGLKMVMNNGIFQEMPEIRKVEKVKRYESKNYQGRELLDRPSLWKVEYAWYL